MTQLTLPPYEARIKATGPHQQIFDVLRRRYVALTPEEWVRQHFVHFLMEHKHYPKGLLGNEIELRIGEKKMRCDTILYDSMLQPRMIIEYKAPEIEITQQVFNQITAYNMILRVDYLIVSNGMQHYCCRLNKELGQYEFLQDIPDYSQL